MNGIPPDLHHQPTSTPGCSRASFARWLCLVCLFQLVVALSAQTRVLPIRPRPNPAPVIPALTNTLPSPPIAPPPVLIAPATNTPPTPEPPKGPSPEELQLQELLKLTFDRSARSVLQSLARQADPAATPTNDVLRFQAAVISSRWTDVGQFLAGLPETNRLPVYKHLLTQLQRVAAPGQNPGGGPSPDGQTPQEPMPFPPGSPQAQQAQAPVILTDDVLALADLAPVELTDELADSLGRLLTRSLSRGNALEPLVARLEAGTAKLGGSDPARRDRAARLLIAANRLADAGRFLPDLEAAEARGDLKAVDLHARYLVAQGKRGDTTNAPALLRQAWDLTQSILTATNAAAKDRDQALARSLELLSSLPRDAGTQWLRESFERQPVLGMNLLAAVGALVQQGAANRDPEARARNLEWQQRTAESLLMVMPQPADSWRTALNVLALSWVQEADQSRLRWQPARQNYQQFDPYGNPIYMDGSYYNPGGQDPNQIPPIAPDRLAPLAPAQAWLALLDPTLVPRIRYLQASLHLKVEGEDKALPIIEELAPTQPKLASELAAELLRAWARTHNPNAGNFNPNFQRYYPYGRPMQTGVSLTRAHQVRNLQELNSLLQRLRSLPTVNVNESAIAAAFTAAHSDAEVFRVEDIESVFGPMQGIPQDTTAELLQTMRQRLAGQWRQPRVQQDAKTRRTDKEIEAEVMRGYQVVGTLIDQAITRRPDSWRLHAARGAVLFDAAEFDYGRKVDLALYTAKRDNAFGSFRRAAALYAESIPGIPEAQQNATVHTQWFNSLLGASDLAYLTRQQEPATNQLEEVRAALLTLPAETVERHLASFGQALSEAANQIKPELKPRYLRAGLRIVGNHPSADEVRRLVRYYDDLLGELTLDVRVDGDPAVGHREPFGVFVSIRHSTAVSRESGGFAKYLQNPGNRGYYYNPPGGGGLSNYRDNFEKQVREKLGETFEILTVAFHEETVEARGVEGRPQWRETPYAYLLLKAKDAANDRIPALQLDMDFVDRRGQVVLPVASQIQWIDARPERPPRRPVEQVELTQILDDRPAAQGHLTLEIKASGRGLLPEMKELVDLSAPGFTIDPVPEPALTITRLDPDGSVVAALSERSVLLTLRPDPKAGLPATFQFPKPRLASAKTTFKRYADADVVEVKTDVALAGLPLRPAPWWRWPLVAAVLAAVAGCAWIWRRRHPSVHAPTAARYALPPELTPFTVLNLLRRIQTDPALSLPEEHRASLDEQIRDLERAHFSRQSGSAPSDLEELARRWIQMLAQPEKSR